MFLQTLTTALRARAACIWRSESDSVQMIAHRQAEQTGLRPDSDAWNTHAQLLCKICLDNKPVRLKPGEVTPAGTNPLSLELFCIPISTTSGVPFVVEVFSPPPNPGEERNGRLARLNLLCQYFQDYVQTQELRAKADQLEAQISLRTFATRLNAASSVRDLVVIAVNDGRQTIGCDRLSLGWMAGSIPQILSVSGHDVVDPRSNAIKALARLTKVAAESKTVLQMQFPATTGELPPEAPQASGASSPAIPNVYQSAIDLYPATDRPRCLLVIPLVEPNSRGAGRGALIVEQFQEDGISNAACQRAAFVSEQVRIALQRQELLESIPFRSWWSRPKRGRWPRLVGRWLAVTSLLAAVGGLACLPMELRLPADGELLAQTRHAVFAPENGVIREVHCDHGSRVHAGETLLTIDNLELNSQMRDLTGQLVQLREKQRSLDARRSGSRLTEREQIELQSGLVEVASSVEHVNHQINLLQQRLDRLKVVAPADGIVTSWNLKQTLLNRTVQSGDALLQEIEPGGRWIIEVRIPEDRAGYVARSLTQQDAGNSMKVEFVLATEPERRYPGTLRSLGSRTDMTADGHVVRAIVDLDETSLPPLRDGAEVKARLHCGKHRAGFVWFRELIEVIQTYWWY